MIIHEVAQLSAAWWELHRGRPTAGDFGRIITPKKCQLAAAAESFICELVAGAMGCEPPARFQTDAMRQGTEREAEARRWYEFECGEPVRQVGFCMSDDGRFGCSPDGLVGDYGGLELKCPQPATHVKWLLAGEVPAEHLPQVHGELLVAERAWIDFASYCPPLPPLKLRVVANPFTVALAAVLDEFYAAYQAALAKILAA